MAGPTTTFSSSVGASSMPSSMLEEELMDFESAAAHFALGADEWGLSELDEEALQGIVQGRTSSSSSSTTNCNNNTQGDGVNNGSRNSLKLTSSSSTSPSRLSTSTMKIDTSDTNDIFGCVRFGSSNGFGTNKGRPSMISAKYRLKEERRKVLKISIGKLKRIEDPESSLCRSVLINNTMKRLQREAREEKLQRQSIYQPQQVVTSFERNTSTMDDLKPIEPVGRSVVVTQSVNSSSPSSPPIPSSPAVTSATPLSNSSNLTCNNTTSTSNGIVNTSTSPISITAAANSRKRSATGDVECDECDVQDVLSHFYMPPTPRLLTSIDDEDDVLPPKRQRLDETNNNTTAVQLPSMNDEQSINTTTTTTIQQLPSIDSSLLSYTPSSLPPPSSNNNNNNTIILNNNNIITMSPNSTERLQSELCNNNNNDTTTMLCNKTTSVVDAETEEEEEEEMNVDIVVDTLDNADLPAIHERLTSHSTIESTPRSLSSTPGQDDDDDDDDDEVIDVVNESSTSSPFHDFHESCNNNNNTSSSEVLSTNRLRDFSTTTDETSRYSPSTGLSVASHESRRCTTSRPNPANVCSFPSSPCNIVLTSSSSNQVSNGGVATITTMTNCSGGTPASSSAVTTNSCNTTSSSVLDASSSTNEQQHFSCGHSSIFGELQSVVFHSLIASLES